ncbi:histidine phosphatase family protein [Nocardia bovistercoris]|uniref:histidine phosphatase family protein n=1 Tax=Nocardia bovistercoris TaxID=2785916 RepID=UPI002FCD6169
MNSRVRLWCLRHGESENVTAGVAGAVPSAPLTSRGLDQSAAAADTLADEPIAHVYCSTALRARQTAEALLPGRAVDITAVADLAEVGIGAAEGSTDSAVRRETSAVLRSWIVERRFERRVADGESGTQVLTRMTTVLERIAQTHGGESVALVGHVASLSVTLARLCGLGAQVWGKPLPHATPFLVERKGRYWECRSWPE